MVTVIVLSIGDELVLGQTVDTNSAWISRELAAIGLRVIAHETVGDDQAAIEAAIVGAAARCEVLLISGGLGPTEDDLTRQALAGALGVPLEEHAEAMAALVARFAKFGRSMSPSNRIQAMVPRGTEMIENTAGTACGMSAELSGCEIFVMPGVPGEMKAMMSKSILPLLRERGGGAVIRSRTLHTFGLGESVIGEMLGDLMDRRRNPSVGTTVADGVVSLRINSAFDSVERADAELAKTEAECRRTLGDLIYGEDQETLALVVHRLIGSAVAEQSGELRKPPRALPGVPGRSRGGVDLPACGDGGELYGRAAGEDADGYAGVERVFWSRGWVTYTNEAKTALLGVPAELIAAKGAVSVEVAEAMAMGALVRSGSDAAVSVTGIAGPEGGTEEKPVGTVCFGLAFDQKPRRRCGVGGFGFPGIGRLFGSAARRWR